ncbi:MAG TPA: DUF2892 domain-containing protein [Spirochaetia bacterium]|nr:DUF2892 domain-containing protein [Spirochaetia bacterium]
MKQNMAVADRIIRVVIAALIATLALTGVLHGTLAIVLVIVGAVFLVTAIVGFCPLYALFGASTKRVRAS